MSKKYFTEDELHDYVTAAAEEFIVNFISTKIPKSAEVYFNILGSRVGDTETYFNVSIAAEHQVETLNCSIDVSTASITVSVNGYTFNDFSYVCKIGNIKHYYSIDIKFDDEDTFVI